MVCNIKSTPEEQYKAERKRFLTKMKPKPVLAEQIKRKEERRKATMNMEELRG